MNIVKKIEEPIKGTATVQILPDNLPCRYKQFEDVPGIRARIFVLGICVRDKLKLYPDKHKQHWLNHEEDADDMTAPVNRIW